MITRSISNFRNFIFGVEDSLVSTVGLLSGIAIADASPAIIFITGLVLIFVEAFSMAAGSFLSENSAAQMESGKMVSIHSSLVPGIIMFCSYFVSGFVPLAPYLFLSTETAFFVSIICSLAALFLLGVVSGALTKTSRMMNGIKMFLIGGIAIAVGVAVGELASRL